MLHVIEKTLVAMLVVMLARAESSQTDSTLDQAKEALNAADTPLPETLTSSIDGALNQAIESAKQVAEREKVKSVLTKAVPDPVGVKIGEIGMGDREADISRLVNRFNQMPVGGEAQRPQHTLFVFVSESVPKPAMKRLLIQSEKVGFPLVFRGFVDGSMRKTLVYIQQLLEIKASETKVETKSAHKDAKFIIDPVLFKKFAINQAPAFTVVRSGALCIGPTASCGDQVPEHYSVFGDVSLMYAVDSLQRLAPSFSRELDPVSEALELSY